LHEHIRSDGVKYGAGSSDNRASPDLYAWGDKGGGGDPCAGANRDWGNFEFEIFASKIVTACAKIGALTDANVGFDCHRSEAENAYVLADPNMVADNESPRKGNVHIVSDYDAMPDGSAKESQQFHAQRRGPWEGCLKKHPAHKNPQAFLQS
jgi:hypothetical protein